MTEIFTILSPIFLILTLALSVFVVSGVFIDKFKNNSSEKTYPKWRVVVLWVSLLLGYMSGAMNEFVLFDENMSSLRNLIIILFFYFVSGILVSFFALKRSVEKDGNGQEVDYRNVQFFLILVFGFLPIILLS